MKQLHRSFTLYFWYRHLFRCSMSWKVFFSVSLFVFTTKANFGKQTWKPIYCELLETLGKVAKHISCDMRESLESCLVNFSTYFQVWEVQKEMKCSLFFLVATLQKMHFFAFMRLMFLFLGALCAKWNKISHLWQKNMFYNIGSNFWSDHLRIILFLNTYWYSHLLMPLNNKLKQFINVLEFSKGILRFRIRIRIENFET